MYSLILLVPIEGEALGISDKVEVRNVVCYETTLHSSRSKTNQKILMLRCGEETLSDSRAVEKRTMSIQHLFAERSVHSGYKLLLCKAIGFPLLGIFQKTRCPANAAGVG